jgi:hypothetical protein
MGEDLLILALVQEHQKPDMHDADNEAHERADGREHNRAQYARKVIAAPRTEEQAERAENGGDDVVHFSHEQGGGKPRLSLQGGRVS